MLEGPAGGRPVLKELIAIFRGDPPAREVTDHFTRMLGIAQGLVLEASEAFWARDADPARREAIFRKDVEVNRLERRIRKKVLTHLAVGSRADLPFGLVMMSVVKDVERLGDYAKNLVEAVDLHPGPLPDHPLVQELGEIRAAVEGLAREAADVYGRSDRPRATELTREGRSVARRCEDLVAKVAASDFSPSAAVTVALASRYYKRIEKHLLNLLSSVIMPLHKLDYFDEDALDDKP
jgi:phosphate transport system protein